MSEKSFTVIFIAITIVAVIGIIATRLINSNSSTPLPSASQPQPTQPVEEATQAASNFIFLADDKFYDGLTFHRVVPGFVIQGGDPLGNGTGGPGYRFADEPVKRKYDKGIVAMANSGPDTNGSQFFIMLEDNPGLPPNYTIFGKVTKGLDVVGKIAVGDMMETVTIAPLK